MRQDPEVRKCKNCGQMPPLHAYTCKELPPRQDVVDFLRAQLESAGREIEQLKKDKEALIEQRDAAYKRQDAGKLIRSWIEQDAIHCEQCGGGPCKGVEGKTLGAGEPCPRCTYQMPVDGPCTKCGYVVKAKQDICSVCGHFCCLCPMLASAAEKTVCAEVRPNERNTCGLLQGREGDHASAMYSWPNLKTKCGLSKPLGNGETCKLDAGHTGACVHSPEEALNQLTQEAQNMGMYDAPTAEKCQVDVPIQGGDTRRCWMPLPCQAHPKNQEHQHVCPKCKISFSCGGAGCTNTTMAVCGECDPVGG